MGQKVNPISLRLQQTNREFDNCWYTNYFYRKLVSRDIYLQQYVNSFLKLLKCPTARFSIQYSTKNIKLSTFLCNPKQSRELRSRMFGITLKKKRKTPLKKRFQLSTKLLNKKNTFRFFKHKKTLKFLIDHRLWSRVYNPFYILKKQNSLVSVSKKTKFFLNNNNAILYNTSNFQNIYNNIVFRTSRNKKVCVLKNYINKPLYFLLPYLSVEFSHKTKNELISIPFSLEFQKKKNQSLLKNNFSNLTEFNFKSLKKNGTKTERNRNSMNLESLKFHQIKDYHFNKKERYDLLYFIKNFVINLFFIKIFNISKSRKLGSFLFHKNEKQFSFFTKKKNQQYKNFVNFNIEYRKNLFKYFLVFYLLYIECNRNNRISTYARQNIVNSIQYFSNFQPISIIHTTIHNKTPFNLLLQQSTPFFSKDAVHSTVRVTPLKNMGILTPFTDGGLAPLNNGRFNILLKNQRSDSKKQQICLFDNIKKDLQQELKYKNYIQYFLGSQFLLNTEFLPFVVSQDWQSAGFLADEIVYFLERRVTFRRLKHKIMRKISENSNIRGVRISCSGRVGGKSKKAQRAKTECVKYGQTSRHTFSSRIDFAVRTARTIFGSVGIKVWICYN